MTQIISRRGLLHIGCGTAAAFGISSITGELGPVTALAQNGPANNALKVEKNSPTVQADSGVQLFYRDDSFGEPWIKREPVLLIHSGGESSIVWYGWVPRMAQQFRVLRPDLPGYGGSTAPKDFEWSLPNIAKILSQFLDTLGIDSAHIIGAKLGGTIAMQFAADYPRRTRTLVLAAASPTTPVFTMGERMGKKWVTETQRDRLGSASSNEQVEYWSKMMDAVNQQTKDSVNKVTAALNMYSILPRITAPTLVITADRSAQYSVEEVLRYQRKIPKSRLLVLPSDAHHVAVAKADECVTSVLSFIKENKA